MDNNVINFQMFSLLSLGSKVLDATFSHGTEENINLNNNRNLFFVISSAEERTEGKGAAALQTEGSAAESLGRTRSLVLGPW